MQDGERSVALRRVGDTQLVGVLYHTVPGAHPDATAVSALGEIMTVEPGGRLYTALVEAKKAAAVQSYTPALHDPGFVAFFAQLPLSDSLTAARDTMEATLEGVRQAPITQAEVDRVRAKALREFDETIADPARLGIALSESVALGDWRLFFLAARPLARRHAADVQRVAEAYLKPSNRTVGTFVPDAKPDRAPSPPAVDIAAMVKDYKGDPAAQRRLRPRQPADPRHARRRRRSSSTARRSGRRASATRRCSSACAAPTTRCASTRASPTS